MATRRGMLGVALLPLALAAGAVAPEFKHAIDGSPIKPVLKPGEAQTPALQEFMASGLNRYRGQADALAQGKELYERWCQVCHNADGSGRMGPALVGGSHVYPQVVSDAGMFAVIYGGAGGAMQAFSTREITQDEILKVIAYVRSLER